MEEEVDIVIYIAQLFAFGIYWMFVAMTASDWRQAYVISTGNPSKVVRKP